MMGIMVCFLTTCSAGLWPALRLEIVRWTVRALLLIYQDRDADYDQNHRPVGPH